MRTNKMCPLYRHGGRICTISLFVAGLFKITIISTFAESNSELHHTFSRSVSPVDLCISLIHSAFGASSSI